MNTTRLMAIALLALLSACSLIESAGNKLSDGGSSKQFRLAENEAVYWVNSLKVDCVGIAPMACLQVQEGEALNQNDWQLFYSSIEGFNYEAGYIYKLLLKKENIPLDQIPADASSIKYSLINVLEKAVDAKLRLNDIWALESIQTESNVLADMMQRPQLEIQLRDMKLTGSDGCNRFFASIDYLDDDKITFGPIAGTRMFCEPMAVPDRFNQQLNNVTHYVLEDLTLRLFDSAEKELLSFRKVD